VKKLNEIISEINDKEIKIKIDDNNKINIISSYGVYTMMSKNPEEFPSWTKIKNNNFLIFEKKELQEIINKTLYAVSKDEIKPALQGVLFDNKEKLNIVATDGAKLVKVEIEKKEQLDKNIIVPTKFLNLIKSYIKNKNKIFISDNHLKIEIDNMKISSRLINQKFPDYSSVIPLENDKKVRVDKESLLASVKRVSIFSNRSTNQINMSFKENKIIISTKDPENVSSGTETIDCDYIGEEINIGFNGDYLKETIKNQKEGTIEFSMKSSVSATLFKGEKTKEKDVLSLLMPIRMSD
tara:strand:- start:8924 stop:9811 length:888 start_codon:yes stop_codon:yes gene_type:complete